MEGAMRRQFIYVALASALLCPSARANWVETNPFGGMVHALAVAGTNLLAGTEGGGVVLFTNSGSSWTAVNSGLTSMNVDALAVAGTNLFAGTGGGVFLSTDNGTRWAQVWTGSGVRAFAVSDTNLFVGGEVWGVYLATTSGTRWRVVDTGFPSRDVGFNVNALAVSGGYLVAGTNEARVWRRWMPEMLNSVDPSASTVPREFQLLQNYPNPFNPSTTIRYELPKSSEVRLNVFDILGREVSVLVNERRDAGVHEVKCDAVGLASGVYFYRLVAGSFVQTCKMVLIR